MRPLEWLFLLSFVPILFIPFLPNSWRMRRSLLALCLLVFTLSAHLLLEGWRIQLVPLYILAALVVIVRLPTLRGENVIRRGRGVLASIVIASGLVVGGVGAGWLLPVVTLPDPTGPFSVGIVDHELVDEARDRRLMVSVWYPASQIGRRAPLTHHPDEVATALGDLSGLPGIGLQHLRYFTTAANENVPIAEDRAPFPVLLFSHGLVGLRLQNSSTLQELASWGYVVVAIDHTDAAAVTVFPDGEARFYDLAEFGIPTGTEPDVGIITERVFPVWVADQQFVYDTLEAWQVNDPLLAGNLDLSRIGSFGHSFGGATALEVCRVDSRCQAAVNLDGGLYGDIMNQPAVRPLLLMTSAESAQFTESMDEWTALVNNANDAAYWLELPNSTHFSFTITQLLSPLLVPNGFDPRAGLGVVDKVVRAFFEDHLNVTEAQSFEALSDESDVRWIFPVSR